MLRILIVDDSARMRSALRLLINTHAGWQVCGEASNGAEGVSAAAQLKPDVAVLDFSMPLMNGVEAAAQIRRLVPEAHLLMFTCYADSPITDAALSAGIETLVAKDEYAKLMQALQQFEMQEGVASGS